MHEHTDGSIMTLTTYWKHQNRFYDRSYMDIKLFIKYNNYKAIRHSSDSSKSNLNAIYKPHTTVNPNSYTILQSSPCAINRICRWVSGENSTNKDTFANNASHCWFDVVVFVRFLSLSENNETEPSYSVAIFQSFSLEINHHFWFWSKNLLGMEEESNNKNRSNGSSSSSIVRQLCFMLNSISQYTSWSSKTINRFLFHNAKSLTKIAIRSTRATLLFCHSLHLIEFKNFHPFMAWVKCSIASLAIPVLFLK